jgi:hypothetical protein
MPLMASSQPFMSPKSSRNTIKAKASKTLARFRYAVLR